MCENGNPLYSIIEDSQKCTQKCTKNHNITFIFSQSNIKLEFY